jgi:spermidine synthase
VRSYATFIPSFWADWGFLIASNGLDPAGVPPDLLRDRLSTRGAAGVENLAPRLDFYDPDAHMRMFALPKDVKARLNHQPPAGDTPPARAQ